MKIKTSTYLFFLCVLSLTYFSACKKVTFGSEIKGQLIGGWTATPIDSRYMQTIYFGADDSVRMHYVYLGTPNSAATYKGTYYLEDNKLNVKATEITTQDGNKAPTITKLDYPLFDKATVKIDANILTIDYITYPADGPVPTRQKFIKN